ncbi:MAG: cytochrome P450 [Gammaproteobacteria bacterium]|jgi:cytochrome P450
MSVVSESSQQIPEWVPEHLVVDFDVYSPSQNAADFYQNCVDFQRNASHRVLWSTHHGGHWVPTQGQDVFDIYADHERFSSKYFFIPAVDGQGELGAFTLDPPHHQPFRTFLNKGMSPNVVAAKKDFVREFAGDLIDGLKDGGGCEFIGECGDILPLIVFLDLVELPFDDRKKLGDWVGITTREPDPDKRVAAIRSIADYLKPFLTERRQSPGNDMLSAAATAEVNGKPMPEDSALGSAIHLLEAGLDTVSSMLGFVMIFLAENPAHRRALVEDPSLIPRAANELIRRFPNVTMVRQVRQDMEYLGVTMKQGDMVAIQSAFYNLDENIYENPLSVDWDRRVKQVLTFGNGVHRCPGAALGLAELVIFLEEWLKRIPDFALAHEEAIPVCGGTVAKILELPLVWRT